MFGSTSVPGGTDMYRHSGISLKLFSGRHVLSLEGPRILIKYFLGYLASFRRRIFVDSLPIRPVEMVVGWKSRLIWKVLSVPLYGLHPSLALGRFFVGHRTEGFRTDDGLSGGR